MVTAQLFSMAPFGSLLCSFWAYNGNNSGLYFTLLTAVYIGGATADHLGILYKL